MLANRTSRWSIGAALLCVVVLAASWFLLISPRRADATDIRGQATSADSQAAQLQLQLTRLKAQFASLPKQRAELEAIKRQLPPTGNVPGFVRDLQDTATATGVTLQSITPGTPTVLSADGVAASTSTAAGVGAVVSIPTTLVLTGEYFEAALFLKSLQTKLARSYLLNGFTAAPSTTDEAAATSAATAVSTSTAAPAATATAATTLDGPILMTLTGSVFVLLDAPVTLDDVAREAKEAALAVKKKTTTATATARSVPTSTG